MLPVLLAVPDLSNKQGIIELLEEKNYKVFHVTNGKDAQLVAYQQKITFAILGSDLEDNTCLEVLAYLKKTKPQLKIILLLSSVKVLKEWETEQEDLKKLGITDILIWPFPLPNIIKSIGGETQFETWKTVRKADKDFEDEEPELFSPDHEYTSFHTKTIHLGSTAFFDIYIKLDDNKYLKVIHKGEAFDLEKIQKHQDKQIDFIYFKVQDRGNFINYSNTLLTKLIGSSKANIKTKFEILRDVVIKYTEEIYSNGLRTHIVEEGQKVCTNIYDIIAKEKKLPKVVNNYAMKDFTFHEHSFLVTLFSVMLCQNLRWCSESTISTISQASLMHDIGKLKLSDEINILSPREMTKDQLTHYKKHPELGMNILGKYHTITEPVKQIVYQHHELMDGSGYPLGLSGSKIYPLAKVISLTDYFAAKMEDEKLTTFECFKKFIPDSTQTDLFDPSMIRAFVMSFVK